MHSEKTGLLFKQDQRTQFFKFASTSYFPERSKIRECFHLIFALSLPDVRGLSLSLLWQKCYYSPERIDSLTLL